MSTINKPYEFSPNTTASSSQVNDNFDTIYNEFNGSISAANLASNAVTTAKITDSNVTTAKIADSNVTTAKIADGSITAIKTAFGGNFTTSEVDTGFKWVNNATIYKKTISVGPLPNATTKTVAHSITGVAIILDIVGCAYNVTPTFLSLPYAHPTAASAVACFSDTTNITIITGSDRTSYTTGYVTLYYTKT